VNANQQMNDLIRRAAGHGPAATPAPTIPDAILPRPTANAGAGVAAGVPAPPMDMNAYIRNAARGFIIL